MEYTNSENCPEKEYKVASLFHQIEFSEGSEKEDKGITYFEVDKPEDIFDWAVENGFLLHGSPNLFLKQYSQESPPILLDLLDN